MAVLPGQVIAFKRSFFLSLRAKYSFFSSRASVCKVERQEDTGSEPRVEGAAAPAYLWADCGNGQHTGFWKFPTS